MGSVEPLDVALAHCRSICSGWPDSTFVVRGDSYDAVRLQISFEHNAHPAFEPPLHGWSVQAKPEATVMYLCCPLLNPFVRVTTLGAIRDAGGWLAKTPGVHEHCTVGGIDANAFHAILGPKQRNCYSRL